jgi:DNA-directed RNA polymerase alpha subunit
MENSKHLDIIEKSLHEICQYEVLDNELSIKLISVLSLFDIAKEINSKQLQLEYARGRNDVLQEIVNRSSITSPDSNPPKKEWDETQQRIRYLLKLHLADQDIPNRLFNRLRYLHINTIGDLVKYREFELLKLGNLGEKSLEKLKKIINRLDLTFGINVERYRLNED